MLIRSGRKPSRRSYRPSIGQPLYELPILWRIHVHCRLWKGQDHRLDLQIEKLEDKLKRASDGDDLSVSVRRTEERTVRKDMLPVDEVAPGSDLAAGP